jgi:hypothetical protein
MQFSRQRLVVAKSQRRRRASPVALRPFAPHRRRSSRRLHEFASRSKTRVHDRLRTTKTRDSRPRFSGVGFVVPSLSAACHAGGRKKMEDLREAVAFETA